MTGASDIGAAASRRLDEIPRVDLAHLPTPLDPAPRLAAAIGLGRLWIKRDDCTGLALGGNKARKLEYLLAEARALGACCVITTGGAQSNHARMTAAACCRLGLECRVFLSDPEPDTAQGNLLLNRLFGAGIRFLPGAGDAEVAAAMEADAAALQAGGRRAYIIPVGGSTPLGCLGYVRAMLEVAEAARSLDAAPDIVTTAGSLGTLAGLRLGARCFLPGARVHGVAVSPGAVAGEPRAAALIRDAEALLGVEVPPPAGEPPIRAEWMGGGYAVPTPEAAAAIRLAARTEGLLLDPVYTGKALAGLIGLAREGTLRPDRPVIFWHTGGAPALFAMDLEGPKEG